MCECTQQYLNLAQTFFLFDCKHRGLRWWRQAHVVFSEHPKLVLPSRHNVDNCEFIVKEVVCHCPPCTFEGVSHGNHVMESVVSLLIWRGSPAQSHCSWDVLFQLNRTWRLGVICKQDLDTEIEINDIKKSGILYLCSIM